MALDPRHGFNDDALEIFRVGGGFEMLVHDGLLGSREYEIVGGKHSTDR